MDFVDELLRKMDEEKNPELSHPEEWKGNNSPQENCPEKPNACTEGIYKKYPTLSRSLSDNFNDDASKVERHLKDSIHKFEGMFQISKGSN